MKPGDKGYKFYRDPGHGWLEVPLAELARLKIEDKVTPYSYVNPGKQCVYLEENCAYLEEDYDLRLYREARGLDLTAFRNWWSDNVEVVDFNSVTSSGHGVHLGVGNGLPGRQGLRPRHIVRDLPRYQAPGTEVEK